MKWLSNVKIGTKIIGGFLIVVALAVAIAVVGAFSLNQVDADYSNALDFTAERAIILYEMKVNIGDLRRLTSQLDTYADDKSVLQSIKTQGDDAIKGFSATAEEYRGKLSGDPHLADADKQTRTKIINDIEKIVNGYYTTYFIATYNDLSAGKSVDTITMLAEAGKYAEGAFSDIDDLLNKALDLTNETSTQLSDSARTTLLLLIGIAVAAVIIAVIIAIVIQRSITGPIRKVVALAEDVSRGNINVNVDDSAKDETGDMARAFKLVIKNITSIIGGIDDMSKKHNDGDMKAYIDGNQYEGAYKTVASGVNDMVKSYIDMLEDIFGALKSISSGDFAVKLKKYKGDKAVVNTEVDSVINTLKSIVGDIDGLVTACTDGVLSTRADAKKYVGEWASILNGLNGLMGAVSEPISESLSIIGEMAKGNLDAKMAGTYKGDFNKIKIDLNGTTAAVSSYITEIDKSLQSMAAGDLTVAIKREYLGQFVTIKEAINKISSTLNSTISEITASSDQVLTGAKQISQSAMMLAEGATEQASSVQELTATVEEINKQVQDSTKNATEASQMSDKSKVDAEHGNKEMAELLNAMEGIKVASNKIANIIKVIEEIATQTNLLALNAAVEAARAGEHGKGFTVVADSVRDLAVQSQAAAKETSELIQDSINQVSLGAQRANATATSLGQIVEGATGVSAMIAKITSASEKQAEQIGNVSIGLNQISQVVQSNSATSEESAAASEELNSQAETLKSMVAFFKV
ncbi:hypothetical protein FACS189490_06180 [Clostridia bacterium]|nr:hypothetical protein FACS189490_06180 [Clostridia bacterium]